MKKFLQTTPLYVILIPVFFVLHGYVENFGYINTGPAALLALLYGAGAVILYLLLLLLYRRRAKAGVAACFLLGCYFFFGAGYDFLTAHARPLARYTLVLPILLVTAIVLLVIIARTKKSLLRWQLFLNCLFLLYTVI